MTRRKQSHSGPTGESRVGHLSRIKRYMEEAEDRGWWYGPDKTVCDRHVEDGALAQLIAERAEATACSYCDRTGSEPFAAPLDVLIERIGTSLTQPSARIPAGRRSSQSNSTTASQSASELKGVTPAS